MKANRVSNGDFRALGEFRFCLRKFLAYSERAAVKRGITAQQHQALLAIAAESEPLSIGGLAETLLIKPHSALELARRLKRASLVEFTHDENDARRVLLRLSRKGRNKLTAVSSDNLAELKNAAPVFRELIKTLGAVSRRPG